MTYRLGVFTIICFVLIPIQIVTTAASGCLFVLTAGREMGTLIHRMLVPSNSLGCGRVTWTGCVGCR